MEAADPDPGGGIRGIGSRNFLKPFKGLSVVAGFRQAFCFRPCLLRLGDRQRKTHRQNREICREHVAGILPSTPDNLFSGVASDVEKAEKHVKVREVLVMRSWKTIALAIALIGAAGRCAVAPATFAQSTTPRVAVAPQAELFSIGGGGRIGVSIRDVDGSDKTKAAAGVVIESVDEDSPPRKPVSRPETSSRNSTASAFAACASSHGSSAKHPKVARLRQW